jgi:hypothetical protein
MMAKKGGKLKNSLLRGTLIMLEGSEVEEAFFPDVEIISTNFDSPNKSGSVELLFLEQSTASSLFTTCEKKLWLSSQGYV